jgi:hypothetical protein
MQNGLRKKDVQYRRIGPEEQVMNSEILVVQMTKGLQPVKIVDLLF